MFLITEVVDGIPRPALDVTVEQVVTAEENVEIPKLPACCGKTA